MALILAGLAISVAGDFVLARALDLDLACLDDMRGRRALLAETIVCASSAGVKGWLYLAWFAAPLALLPLWLRSRRRPPRHPRGS